MTALRGPCKVVSNIGAQYTVLDLVTNDTEIIHVSRLRPFDYNPDTTDPVDIANRDGGFANVGKIIAHTGVKTDKTKMDFLVRWEGFKETHDSWLPWKELRAKIRLHEYLRTNKMASLIPKSLRIQQILQRGEGSVRQSIA